MNHSNADLLSRIYVDFAKGDASAVLDACAEKMTFQIAGKSQLAGKYTKEDFSSFLSKMRELSGDSLKLEVHEILASDRHGVVLASEHLLRNGDAVQMRTVHVWRFENGKPVAWYE